MTATLTSPVRPDASPLSGALFMARAGAAVFPCKAGTKRPAITGWQQAATRGEAQIRRWADEYPDCNFGATGTVVAVDHDAKAGPEALDGYIDLLVRMPPTLTVQTVSGDGKHHWFLGQCAGGYLSFGNEVRGQGQYAMCPGSIVNGKTYTVIDDVPIAPLPAWISEKLRSPRAVTQPGAGGGSSLVELDHPDNVDRSRHIALTAEPSVEGAGGDLNCFQVACRIRELGISQEVCADLMLEHFEPRCDHVEPGAIEANLKWVLDKVASAYRTAQNTLGSRSLVGAVEPIELEPPPGFGPVPAVADAAPASMFKALDVHLDPASIPPRDWVATGDLLTGSLTAITAPGGIGKSALTLAWAIAVAQGNGQFIGLDVRKQVSVLLLNSEDDEDEIQRRFAALCQHHAIDRGPLAGRVHIFGRARMGKLRFVEPGGNTGKPAVNQAAVDVVLAYARQHHIGLIIIDPLIAFHAVSENSNTEMSAVAEALKGIARAVPAAVAVVHHSRKASGHSSAGQEGDQDSGRGASALPNATRIAKTLCGMSKVDADKHGVPAETRGRYTRLDDAKASYSAKNGRAMWFYNETVKLPNGDGAGALRLAALVEVPSAKGLASAPTSPGVDAFKSALVSANNECGGPPEQSKVRDHFEHLYSPAKPSKNPADAKRKAFAHVRDTLVKQGLIVMGADDRISYAPLGADLPEGDALEFEAGS